MNLEDLANIATIISLPISIISLFVGGQALYKVNKEITIINKNQNNETITNNCNTQNNQINKSKIKNTSINQTVNKK